MNINLLSMLCVCVCVFPVGLIHANHGQKIIEYLTKELRTNQNEVSVW